MLMKSEIYYLITVMSNSFFLQTTHEWKLYPWEETKPSEPAGDLPAVVKMRKEFLKFFCQKALPTWQQPRTSQRPKGHVKRNASKRERGFA